MKRFYLQAMFASFRPFVSGSFRPTAGFITPTAAYGLLLNIAGIEMRHDDGKSAMTLIRQDLPKVKVAIGAISKPHRHTILQQLHNYPIGAAGKEHSKQTKGSKYNIVPVKREYLSNIRAYICMDGDSQLEAAVESGLSGENTRSYGLPFIGDNNFLIDRLEVVQDTEAAFWYGIIGNEDDDMREEITRLTTYIDRADLSQTKSFLFAPSKFKTPNPPGEAWVTMP